MNHYTQPNQVGVGLPIKPPAQIPAAHERVFKCTEDLHGLLGELELSLKPALRLEPSPSCEKAKVAEMPTTIYDKLNRHADSIEAASNRVRELLRLLEI